MPAREWIELHTSVRSHFKTMRLSMVLNTTQRDAVGTLSMLWTWAALYAIDGNITRFSKADIAIAAGWEIERADEVYAALVECELIDEEIDENGEIRLVIHDWDEYADGLQRIEHKREMSRERSKKYRETAKKKREICSGNAPVTRDVTHPSRTRHAPVTHPSRVTGRDVTRRHALNLDLDLNQDQEHREEQEHRTILHLKNEMEHQSAPKPVDNSESTAEPPADATADAEILIDASELSIESGRAKPLRALPDGFSEFWEAYPRRDGKKAAARAWARLPARDRELALGVARVMAQMAANGAAPERQYILQPATYLNGERWNDWEDGPPASWAPEAPRRSSPYPDLDETLREMMAERGEL